MVIRCEIKGLMFRLMRRGAVAAMAAAVVAGIASNASALTITKLGNGRPSAATFVLAGEVTAGDAERFREALQQLPAGTAAAVILNSGGGDLFEGLKLGALFHDARVATFVMNGGECHSACSMAFLGGRDPRSGLAMRVKPSDAKLGFHQFRRANYDPLKIYTKADFDTEVAQTQVASHEIVRYLQRIGEDLSKLQFMLRAPAQGMNVISNEQALASGIAVLDAATGRLIPPGQASQRISSM